MCESFVEGKRDVENSAYEAEKTRLLERDDVQLESEDITSNPISEKVKISVVEFADRTKTLDLWKEVNEQWSTDEFKHDDVGSITKYDAAFKEASKLFSKADSTNATRLVLLISDGAPFSVIP